MTEEKKIQIIKHEDAIPLNGSGDILYPFSTWETTSTADGWYSKVPEEYHEKKLYYPLTAVCQNPWDALIRLGINCFDFKEKVQYECPYNHYKHYWCIPILIFTDNVKFWTDRYKIKHPDLYLDRGRVQKFFPSKVKNGLPFSKIQRALLGPGYTKGGGINDGNGYLYDALVALDNGDYIGVKVWIWFSR